MKSLSMRAKAVAVATRSRKAARAPASDIELIEMANLSAKYTGVEGIIYISTAQGNHGPRVKWYADRPRSDAPSLTVTIERQPKTINNHLPRRVAETAADAVTAWVTLNYDALLEFWNNGNSWIDDEVDEFRKGLKRLG